MAADFTQSGGDVYMEVRVGLQHLLDSVQPFGCIAKVDANEWSLWKEPDNLLHRIEKLQP